MEMRFYFRLRTLQRRGRVKGRTPFRFGWVTCKIVPTIAERAYDNELCSPFNTHRAVHGEIYQDLVSTLSVPAVRSRNLIQSRDRHPKLDRRVHRWMISRQITVGSLIPLRRSRGPERLFNSY